MQNDVLKTLRDTTWDYFKFVKFIRQPITVAFHIG